MQGSRKTKKRSRKLLKWIQRYGGYWYLICTPGDSHMNMVVAKNIIKSLAKYGLYEIFISGKRFQLAEIPLSEKKYASATEKLREEMWTLGDQLFTDVLVQYLIQKAEENVLFGFQVLKKHKSLQKCVNYIMEQAYQIAKKEHEKKFGGKQNTNHRPGGQKQAVGMGIAETQVYQWAEEYYALDDEVKEAKEQAAERKKRLKPLKKKAERSQKAAETKPSAIGVSKGTTDTSAKESKEGPKAPEAPDKDKKNKEEIVDNGEVKQMSMFDLLAG